MAKFRVYLDKLELCPKNLSSTNSFGEFKSYNRNGQPYVICSYIDDKLHGEYKEYHSNEQLSEICTFIDGEYHGKYIKYDENGQLIEFCNYINGIKQ